MLGAGEQKYVDTGVSCRPETTWDRILAEATGQSTLPTPELPLLQSNPLQPQSCSSQSSFVSDLSQPQSRMPELTRGQRNFFAGITTESDIAASQGSVSFDRIVEGVLNNVQSLPPPASAIEMASDSFFAPQMTSGAVGESFDLVGPAAEGNEYAASYNRGANALIQLWRKLNRSPEELSKMSSEDFNTVLTELSQYRQTALTVHAEGTDHGFNATHALEYLENRAYSDMRGATGAQQVEVTGFNFGINMTDLNKRDPSGKLGDIVRDKVRELANARFGRNRATANTDKGMAFENISQLKNMTFLALDVSESQARNGIDAIQHDIQAYLRSNDFQTEMIRALGPEQAQKISLDGVTLRLAGYFGKGTIDRSQLKTGELQTQILKILGRFHSGEDVASAAMKSTSEATFVHTGKLAPNAARETAMINRAARSLYALFRAPAPNGGADFQFSPEVNPQQAESEFRLSEADVRSGMINRQSHTFGLGLRHVAEVWNRFADLEEAVQRYQQDRSTSNFSEIDSKKRELLEYLKSPPAEIDPSRTPVLDRMAQDFARSRHVYRFRTKDGMGMVAFKRGHMGQVVEDRSRGNTGKQWLVGLELGKVGDYMKKYAPTDGIQDPVFSQLLDVVTQGLREKGFDVEMAVMGGDEFLVHLRETPGSKKTDADLKEALGHVIGTFERAHAQRSFTYSEKTSLPGGRWNGMQFGVKDGRVLFKHPEGLDAASTRNLAHDTVQDPQFRKALVENFGMSPEQAARLSETSGSMAIMDEASFNLQGDIGRRDVWRPAEVNTASGGKPNELYLNPGQSCNTEDAYRPERTLTMEASAAPMTHASEFTTIVGSVLPKGIQQNKRSGGKIAMLPELTLQEKARTRAGLRVSLNAGSFMLASIGSRFLYNVGDAIATGDASVLTNRINPLHTLGEFGAMTVGTVGGEMLARSIVTGLSGDLVRAGRVNWKALMGPRVGMSRAFMSGMGEVGALVATDLLDDGKVDPMNVLHGMALMKAARVLTNGLEVIAPLRRATNINPVKMVIEFIVMEGLSRAEEKAVIELKLLSLRTDLGRAMQRYDDAVLTASKLDPVTLEGDQQPPEVEALGRTHAEVVRAYSDCMQMERYLRSPEYATLNRILEEEAAEQEKYLKAPTTETSGDTDMAEMRHALPERRPGSSSMSERQLRAERIRELHASYLASMETSNSSYEEHLRTHGSELVRSGRAMTLHIPYAHERKEYVQNLVGEFDYRGMESGADGNLHGMYRDWLASDVYDLDIQVKAFLAERQAFLTSSLKSSSR